MVEQHEIGTTGLSERIEAARKCQQHCYRIRFRIDPGILYPTWQEDYADLIEKTLTIVKPENITLGMLRLLPGHFQLAADTYGNRARKLLDSNFVKGASDHKLRYRPEQRI